LAEPPRQRRVTQSDSRSSRKGAFLSDPLNARDHLAFRPQAAPLSIRFRPCGAQIALLTPTFGGYPAPRGKAESTSKWPGARILRRSHASSGFEHFVVQKFGQSAVALETEVAVCGQEVFGLKESSSVRIGNFEFAGEVGEKLVDRFL